RRDPPISPGAVAERESETEAGVAQVAAHALRGLFDVGHERHAGNTLDRLDVAAHGLNLHCVWNFGDWAVTAEALRGQEAPHVLLVEALRILAGREPLFVGVLVPEARRVR